jgi:hypothetical protein
MPKLTYWDGSAWKTEGPYGQGTAGGSFTGGSSGPTGPTGPTGPAGPALLNADGGTPTSVYGGITPIDCEGP